MLCTVQQPTSLLKNTDPTIRCRQTLQCGDANKPQDRDRLRLLRSVCSYTLVGATQNCVRILSKATPAARNRAEPNSGPPKPRLSAEQHTRRCHLGNGRTGREADPCECRMGTIQLPLTDGILPILYQGHRGDLVRTTSAQAFSISGSLRRSGDPRYGSLVDIVRAQAARPGRQVQQRCRRAYACDKSGYIETHLHFLFLFSQFLISSCGKDIGLFVISPLEILSLCQHR